ncbi:hypothetical protein Aph01nite_46850 [Acrocarpospora phusangensis]|uniref:Uncharacterized protein n=1 Tax=Acrocarpospora phusangensis TaxID=1070424 RepID=A0A919USE7_9ACTN|nr:hypothetical protein [Acrocarpospora phusangensis]GIH26375.1 hypothetical protein Aph01nite_46850 [Acrocarpospora phusangensis]
MANAPDLNELRRIIQDAQQAGPSRDRASEEVSVGREGEIYTGDAPGDQPLSTVQLGTFASPSARAAELRTRIDQRFAAGHMPRNTVFVNRPDARGWCYSIKSAMGRVYTMFAYYDGRQYQVNLLDPQLQGHVGAHQGHLYPDGRICLSDGGRGGQPTLEKAYSKSVLWATGMDVVLAGYSFPFSVNNLDD